MNENFIATTSNIVFKKWLWKAVGGFQPLRYCHDLDFLMAATLMSDGIYDEELTHIRYRMHPKNTIAEELSKIKVEIGAVIAVYLVELRDNLIEDNAPKKTLLFNEFLKNKNMSDLLVTLILLYLIYRDRTAYYNVIYRTETKEQLKCLFV